MDTNGSAPSRRRRVVKTATPASQPRQATDSLAGEPALGDAGDAGSGAARQSDGAATAGTASGAGSGGEPGPGDGPGSGAAVRSGISLPEATLTSLELHRGAIGRLDAQEVDVHFGAIGAARAEEIEIQLGSIGAAMANQLKVAQGSVGTVLASDARLEQAVVRTLVAQTVVVERPSLIGVLVARRVSGDVRVLLDWRGAIVLGVLAGLIARVGRRR
jgi:hypothetical protein